ncbi:MAG: hypothetical protein ABIP51_09935 [Bacteroidia bacterium]
MSNRIKYFIFCGALLVLFLAVFFAVPDNKFLFKNSLGDCSGRAQFMYNKLYNTKTKADVVLFGSSRIMNGVNDSTFGKNKILNLGYCRFGRDLDEFFVEEYLKSHQPSKIIIEVRGSEGDNSHPLTPFLMPVSKIAEEFYTLDVDVFSNLYNKWLCNLKYIRNKLFDKSDTLSFENNSEYGYWENYTEKDEKKLIDKRAEDSLELLTEKPNVTNRNAEFYLSKIKELCEQKKIQLLFLYIPSYGNVCKTPELQKIYSENGTCILPPDSIFCNINNFADYNHLNKAGAKKFSLWLNKVLEE